jgi:hypothetical protein
MSFGPQVEIITSGLFDAFQIRFPRGKSVCKGVNFYSILPQRGWAFWAARIYTNTRRTPLRITLQAPQRRYAIRPCLSRATAARGHTRYDRRAPHTQCTLCRPAPATGKALAFFNLRSTILWQGLSKSDYPHHTRQPIYHPLAKRFNRTDDHSLARPARTRSNGWPSGHHYRRRREL